MPPLSLVVCLQGERELLDRLLQKSSGCFDDLVVVHDGPDETGVRGVVEAAGGRFFERPREYQQEPHWPFAWGQAKHDWILRLDADEFPSVEMKSWLQDFQQGPGPEDSLSGYTCIWPLWDGQSTVSKRWPAGRYFLFHRDRVRFFGMVEQVPVPDGRFEPMELVLHHQPKRKSYGFRNLVLREQAYRWRECIARSLLGRPSDLACWRWGDAPWPPIWENLRRHPIRTGVWRLARSTLAELRDQWRREGRLFPVAAVSGPVHHALIGLELRRLRRRRASTRLATGVPTAETTVSNHKPHQTHDR